MKNIRSIAFLGLFIIGCKPNNKNLIQSIKFQDTNTKNVYSLKGDSLDLEINYLYSNGFLKEVVFEKNLKIHGLNQEFYFNGNLKSKGYWFQGKKLGRFDYFYESGKLKEIRYYIPFRDTNIAKLNEIIKFNESGDTLLSKSMFFLLYDSGDSVSNGETYSLLVKLRGHYFQHSRLKFCDFDEKYSFKSNRCDDNDMVDHQGGVSIDNYKLGENTVRGVIVNYDDTIVNGTVQPIREAEVYFTRKFYVKAK